MNTIKSFSVGYNPINKHNIFSSGEGINGQVTLELSKDCQVKSFCIKLKGKAEVKWTENHGKNSTTYHNKEKYFSIKQFIFHTGNQLINQGCHVYPFSFYIPTQELPSSFKGAHGKILYTLEANLSRSMRLDSKAKAEFTLMHKANLDSDPRLKAPQHSIVDKKMSLFNSGSVSMDVNIDRTGIQQERQHSLLVASIENRSSREIKPKYSLNAKYSYFAKSKRKIQLKEILKEVGEVVPPSASQTVTKIIHIPPELHVSVHNCSILKVEYRLKVYLDVKYASDPEIKFPIIILPAIARPEVQDSDFPASGFEAFPQPDMFGGPSLFQNPTATGPSAPPPPYETYGMYPSLGGFNQNTYQ
uniref:Arrestin domain-containing protein 3-like n=1 Tax=Gouania willdenowi TaxID=441366 RepID=A0A8C5I808_GOUWI